MRQSQGRRDRGFHEENDGASYPTPQQMVMLLQPAVCCSVIHLWVWFILIENTRLLGQRTDRLLENSCLHSPAHHSMGWSAGSRMSPACTGEKPWHYESQRLYKSGWHIWPISSLQRGREIFVLEYEEILSGKKMQRLWAYHPRNLNRHLQRRHTHTPPEVTVFRVAISHPLTWVPVLFTQKSLTTRNTKVLTDTFSHHLHFLTFRVLSLFFREVEMSTPLVHSFQ